MESLRPRAFSSSLFILLAALQAGIRLAEGDVAGGVLVKKSVVEQDLLVGDGAVVGHQGHLAEIGGALVHGNSSLQRLLALFRAWASTILPSLTTKWNLSMMLPSWTRGRAGVHHAVDAALQRGGEDLLRGDVGDITPGRRASRRLPACPNVALRQLHRQVRPQGSWYSAGT